MVIVWVNSQNFTPWKTDPHISPAHTAWLARLARFLNDPRWKFPGWNSAGRRSVSTIDCKICFFHCVTTNRFTGKIPENQRKPLQQTTMNHSQPTSWPEVDPHKLGLPAYSAKWLTGWVMDASPQAMSPPTFVLPLSSFGDGHRFSGISDHAYQRVA